MVFIPMSRIVTVIFCLTICRSLKILFPVGNRTAHLPGVVFGQIFCFTSLIVRFSIETACRLYNNSFPLVLSSAALVELAKPIHIHHLILSSHLCFCFPFTVSCKIVLAKPGYPGMWPNHLSFHFLTRVRSSS